MTHKYFEPTSLCRHATLTSLGAREQIPPQCLATFRLATAMLDVLRQTLVCSDLVHWT